MNSTLISRTSAGLLLVGGLGLLFAPDVILPRLITGYPEPGLWLGQLLGATWLALAALNWLGRTSLLGGIYGRSVVMPNAAFYFITAMVLIKAVSAHTMLAWIWIVMGPVVLMAGVYSWLLFRGPMARDMEIQRGAPFDKSAGRLNQ